ncbi:glycoside hydrolase family 97 catalytic domain-containing protein [Pontibacillus salicampi]|uniref:Glycoside hydrolase family 97 catalytic domain-containing protein n=1 Tax=Pontibacillus salicampi TaxID=1449801 RepID=A0ABV6LTG2_9BACI
MRKRMWVGVLVICLMLPITFKHVSAAADTTQTITSPNGKVKVDVTLDKQGKPHYQVTYNGEKIVEPSSLGFEFKDQAPLQGDFTIVNTSTTTFNEDWKPVWGEKSSIKNHYKQLTIELQEKSGDKRKMNMEFKVYDDGIGFRYVIPEQKNVNKDLQITAEHTEFAFAENNTSWWIPNDWNSYEYNYNETKLEEVKEVSTPLTMKTPKGTHVTIHEAALIDYSGMALKAVEGKDNALTSILAPYPNSEVKVKKDKLPVETPWRTIQLGETAGDLMESDMILNLNEPNAIEDTSWINPMKYVGIWWEMHIRKSTWESGPKHGATTENAKKYIDFANEYLDSENQPVGLLVEGWNVGWDGDWTENGDLFDFTKPYPDFDLEEVVKYGKEKSVEYIAHNETSGDIQNYEAQMDDAYDLYQSLGIHSIKSGYVADNGIKDPEGETHHGQFMVNHYLNAVKKAADHEIMINTHEPIKPTGVYRTYPNWMSREGVMGMEYNAWSEGSPPNHLTVVPFTRMMGGPVDYNPGIFDVQIEEQPNNRVHTTRAQQIAAYVTLTSGVQMVTDLPENYKDEDGNILPEFQFIKDVPVTWDDTMVPNSEIGNYITVVRRSGEEWYVGSTTDENARAVDVSLDFLPDDKQYVAEIYSDGADADWESNPNPVSIHKVIVDSKDTLVASMAAGGGQAVRMYPASKSDQDELPEYEESSVDLEYKEIPSSIQSNDELKVTVEAKNEGNTIASKTVNLMVDNKKVAEKAVRIDPDSSKAVTLTYNKLFETGDYRVEIEGLSPKTVTVKEKKPTFAYSGLEVSTDDQSITAKATVTNYGTTKGTVTVPLKVNGKVVDRKEVEVDAAQGGASKNVTFVYDAKEEAGAYEVSIGDTPTKVAALPTIQLAGEWLFQRGDNEDWKKKDVDESSWDKVTLPNSWENHSNYTEDNVFGWYRKTITIPKEWEGYSLKVKLGRIDDVDQTFVNGQEVGQSGTFPTGEGEQGMVSAWDWDREYEIPAEAIQYGEENVISIRVFDASYGGGVYEGPLGPIELVKKEKEEEKDKSKRIAGDDRYNTAIQIAQEGWESSETVVIARGDDFADALAGAPLAYKEDAPILLTKTDDLLKEVKEEIKRLGAKDAIILGGPNAISGYVSYQLEGIGLRVERVNGDNRYGTAMNIAARLDGNPDKAIIANGSRFPDALAVAPYAAENGYPILLTKEDSLPSQTVKALRGISQTAVVGGPGVVNDEILTELPQPTRYSGDDRYETAAAIAKELNNTGTTAFVSTGEEFADALTGSVLAAKQDGTTFLVRKDRAPDSIKEAYQELGIETTYILGGENAVSEQAKNDLMSKE